MALTIPNKQVDAIYQQLMKEWGAAGSDYKPIQFDTYTKEQLSDQTAQYLRPTTEKAIEARRGQTVQSKAALDTDAAARGMGQSTWLTDYKGKLSNAESTDIAGLESDYSATLLESVIKQFQDQQNKKAEIDTQNAAIYSAFEQDMYERALKLLQMQQAAAGGGGGGGYRRSGGGSGGSGKGSGQTVSFKYVTSGTDGAEKQYKTDNRIGGRQPA